MSSCASTSETAASGSGSTPTLNLSTTPKKRTTFISTSHLSALPPDTTVTLSSLLEESDRLSAEARELMPGSIKECTYEKGYLRQEVYACLDCGGKGVCYGCGVACHAEHNLVELFTRRSFRCDCPTSILHAPYPPSASTSTTSFPKCTLNPGLKPESLPPNDKNKYGKNFKGEFCRCGRVYDPQVEKESMVCCIGCEDWFHESCLNLQDANRFKDKTDADPTGSTAKPLSVDSTPASSTATETLSSAHNSTAAGPSTSLTTISNGIETPKPNDGEDEDEDDESPILPSSAYEHLICSSCVLGNDYLRRAAGSDGWYMVVKKPSFRPTHGAEWKDQWELLGKDADEQSSGLSTEDCAGKRKVSLQGDEDTHRAKMRKVEDGTSAKSDSCTRPLMNPRAGAILDRVSNGDTSEGLGDVFIKEGEREELCGCAECSKLTSALPFPLVEEPVYEPPEDADEDEEDLDEMTSRALNSLPRSQAIEGLLKFNQMKERLKGFLETFRDTDKVVGPADIADFMQSLRSSK